MVENELQILIKEIFSRIKEKYGYTDEQALVYLKGYEDCAEEHQQSPEKRDKMLRDTVAELCEAKKLLKLAVEDLERLGGAEICFSYCDERCPFYCIGRCEEKHWKHLDEALKLIKED